MQCIYCLKSNLKVKFTKAEHVVSQTLGKFGSDTFVLRDKVCDGCNQQLGNELEIILGRDSIEGLASKEKLGKNLGNRKGVERVRITVPDKPKYGQFAGVVLDKDEFFNNKTYSQASQVHLWAKASARRIVILHKELELIDNLNSSDFDLSKTISSAIHAFKLESSWRWRFFLHTQI